MEGAKNMLKAESLVAVHTHTHTYLMFTEPAKCLKSCTLNKKCSFEKLLNIANLTIKEVGQKPLLSIRKLADYLCITTTEE